MKIVRFLAFGVAAFLSLGPLLTTASEEAAAAIEARGGKVLRDPSQPGRPVVAVDLTRVAVTDADLERIAQFRHLRTLGLTGGRIFDAGLEHLGELKQLRELDLSRSGITDAGLARRR